MSQIRDTLTKKYFGKQNQPLRESWICRGRPDIRNVFVKRLDEYQSSLRRAANLTLGTEYTVAFIGDIGVGKSTAICRAADLEVQEAKKLEPVLEVGGGGVTICEVHLVQGPHYGILVEANKRE